MTQTPEPPTYEKGRTVMFPDQVQSIGHLDDVAVLEAIAADIDLQDDGFRYIALGPSIRDRLRLIASRFGPRSPEPAPAPTTENEEGWLSATDVIRDMRSLGELLLTDRGLPRNRRHFAAQVFQAANFIEHNRAPSHPEPAPPTPQPWCCSVCGNMNGTDTAGVPTKCTRCGFGMGTRTYPAFDPTVGQVVNGSPRPYRCICEAGDGEGHLPSCVLSNTSATSTLALPPSPSIAPEASPEPTTQEDTKRLLRCIDEDRLRDMLCDEGMALAAATLVAAEVVRGKRPFPPAGATASGQCL